MKRVGIEKGSRFLDVHSLRYTFNTLVRPILPQALLMQVMGHRSVAMTENYSHASVESTMKQLEGVKDSIEAVFKVE